MKYRSLKVSGYLLIALVMVLSLAFSQSAEAMLMQIRITDSAGTITIDDNDPTKDDDSTVGIIDYTNSTGDGYFKIKTCTGESMPSEGGPTYPLIDLEGKATSIASGNPLILEITQTDFGPMAFLGFLSSLASSKLEGTITLDTYYNNANTPFGQNAADLIAHIGPFTGGGTGPWSGAISSVVPVDDNFSLTMVATITPSGVDKTTQFNASMSPVPEPGTILLLGLGLLGLGFISRKKVKIEG